MCAAWVRGAFGASFTLRPAPSRWACCAAEPTPRPHSYPAPPLTAEAKLFGERAAHAQLALLERRSASATDLGAFLAVKGVPVDSASNPWDVAALRARAERYMAQERLSRLRCGVAWEELKVQRRVALLHAVSNGEGEATYTDVTTGYTVFSAHGHLRRGYCCGVVGAPGTPPDELERTHRCRHCPFDANGELRTSKWRALHARLPVIDMVRDAVQRVLAGDATLLEERAEQPLAPAQLVAAVKSDAPPPFADLGSATVKPRDEAVCDECGGLRVTRCTRCSGWRIVVSPETGYCGQCNATGTHPCMSCTGWRPPAITHFGSDSLKLSPKDIGL